MGRHRKAKTVAVLAAPRDARPVLKQLLGYGGGATVFCSFCGSTWHARATGQLITFV